MNVSFIPAGIILALTLLLSPLAAQNASAPFSGWHAGISSFYLTGFDDAKDNFGGNLRVGYLVEDGNGFMRDGVHLDIGYVDLDFGNGREIGLLKGLVNYQAGGVISEQWFFFVGAGIGGTRANITVPGHKRDSDTALAWQAFTGIEFRPADILSLRAGYRHLWVNPLKHRDLGSTDRVDAGLFEVGMTFWF